MCKVHSFVNLALVQSLAYFVFFHFLSILSSFMPFRLNSSFASPFLFVFVFSFFNFILDTSYTLHFQFYSGFCLSLFSSQSITVIKPHEACEKKYNSTLRYSIQSSFKVHTQVITTEIVLFNHKWKRTV